LSALAADQLALALPLRAHAGRLLAQLGDLARDDLEAPASAPRRRPRARARPARSRGWRPCARGSSIGVGTLSISIFRRDAASSTRSMALSGSCARDVAVRELGGGDERRVLDADAVVDLVLLLEAAQDRDRVLDARLADQHRLEAALERLVLLDVLAVLVERRRADAAQLAARQRRLEHVGGVHARPRRRRRRPGCAARR
jgi:hypothetical protein